jgi:hypothetical protein
MREVILAALLAWPTLANAQTLRGTVTDSLTGGALAGYTIRLINVGKDEQHTVIADSAGQFVFRDLGNGRYELQVEAFGRSFRRGPFTLFRGEVLEITIPLAPTALALAPLTAVANSRSRKLELHGFYDRLINSRPQYMLRDEIEKKNARTIPDLISHMKGVRIERTRYGADVLMRAGLTMGALQAGKTCRPAVWVDGAQMRSGGNNTPLVYLDAMESPNNIEAIEVYGGIAQLPAQYSGAGSGCGAILIWTR